MSYSSLNTQVNDMNLNGRVTAAVQKEAYNNPELSETDYAKALKQTYANVWVTFSWPVSIATEDQYEYALNAGTENPGLDPTVITDEEILSAVQANWPPNTSGV
jgi:hypothetical protein